MRMIDRGGALRNSPNPDYLLDYVKRAMQLLDVDSLGVKYLVFVGGVDCRAYWARRDSTIYMNPYTRSFQPDYRGRMCYRKFGGRADLTPAGVFLHECGHALHDKHPQLLKDFIVIRRRYGCKSITSYATRFKYEDVAECFRLYVSNGVLLRKLQPERYAVIDKYGSVYLRSTVL